jgi:hypothetical protein
MSAAVHTSTRRHFMLRTSSFFGPLNSGFVPFASAAPVDAFADRDIGDAADVESADLESAEAEAAEVVARAAAASVADQVPHAVTQPWAPASSARIRIVEGTVLAAICGYFGWGLLRTLAGV